MKWLVMAGVAIVLSGCAGPGLPGSPMRAAYNICRTEGGEDQHCRDRATLETWRWPVQGLVVVPIR